MYFNALENTHANDTKNSRRSLLETAAVYLLNPVYITVCTPKSLDPVFLDTFIPAVPLKEHSKIAFIFFTVSRHNRIKLTLFHRGTQSKTIIFSMICSLAAPNYLQ